MSLPNVDIELSNGGLGRSVQASDGSPLLIVSTADVDGSVVDKIITLTSPDDSSNISASINPYAYRQVTEFYQSAGNGTKLYVILSSKVIITVLSTVLNKELDLLSDTISMIGFASEFEGSGGK
jgi:hypothetical protein